ncbi:unnamed protein product [Sphagnum jensenii]|uniref:Uncharacterized protein n=1 Tax=Sphagnum jensenii TaxID=128206 RepID=A0ABP0VA25_9BRYO
MDPVLNFNDDSSADESDDPPFPLIDEPDDSTSTMSDSASQKSAEVPPSDPKITPIIQPPPKYPLEIFPYRYAEPGFLMALGIPIKELHYIKNQNIIGEHYFVDRNNEMNSMFSLAYRDEGIGLFKQSCQLVYAGLCDFSKLFHYMTAAGLCHSMADSLDLIKTKARPLTHHRYLDPPEITHCFYWDKLYSQYVVLYISYELVSFVHRLHLILQAIERAKGSGKYEIFTNDEDRVLFYNSRFIAIGTFRFRTADIEKVTEVGACPLNAATAAAEHYFYEHEAPDV